MIHRIHVLFIYTYTFTIRINHSCRYIYRSSHGSVMGYGTYLPKTNVTYLAITLRTSNPHKKKKRPVGRAVGPPDPTSKSGNTRRRTYSPAIRRRTWCWKRSQSHRRDRETWCFVFFFGRRNKKRNEKKVPKDGSGWNHDGRVKIPPVLWHYWGGVSGTGHTSKHPHKSTNLEAPTKGEWCVYIWLYIYIYIWVLPGLVSYIYLFKNGWKYLRRMDHFPVDASEIR